MSIDIEEGIERGIILLMPSYSLLKPKSEDFDFIKKVHHNTLKDHIIQIWGWDQAAQDNFVKEDFESGQIQLIQVASEIVGYLQLYEEALSINIVNILILPEFQRQRLGSQIIRDIIDSSRDVKKTVKLGVFKVNLKAKALYEILGFKNTGETQNHYLMEI